MTSLSQDFRYALRMLRNSPGFTLIAVLTLALGIGANTALFSVVNGVLLRALPYPQPDRLVEVAAKAPPFSESSISYPNFLDWVAQNHTFEALAAYRMKDYDLTGWGDAQALKAMQVSASFFPLLGVKPVLGRNFTAEEDRRGAAPVVMLAYGLWKTKFGGSPDVLGKTVTLDGVGYTVIGVVPSNFYFCCATTNFRLGDAYTAIGAFRNPDFYNRANHQGSYAVGRLKPGVTIEQARADMDGVAHNLAAAYPDVDGKEGVWIAPLKERMVQDVKPMLLVLLAAVGFVLLIACVNVANLLLARSTSRTREFSIRLALGATRGRVIRQLLTESCLLGIAGGALGILLASWGTEAALAVLPAALPRAGNVHLDARVLLFTMLVAIAAGMLFGLAPALKISRPNVNEALQHGGRGSSGARHRAQRVFVVVEMALAVVLLVSAGLVIRSMVRLWNVDPGFDPGNVALFAVAQPATSQETPDAFRTRTRRLVETVAAIPGVESAAITDGAVPMRGDDEWPVWIEGRPKPTSDGELISTVAYIVSPDYWKVMRIPLLRGRLLTAQDTAATTPVCVIDETFASKYFAGQDPVGQRIDVNGLDQKYEIVGIVRHVNQWGLDTAGPVQVELYTLAEQFPDKMLASASFYVHDVVVRGVAPNVPARAAIQDALRAMNTEQVAYSFTSMAGVLSDSLASRRFAVIVLGAFAAVALLLAMIGIYGVVSYVAGQRTHEIGIRLALGAQRGHVLRLILGGGGRLAAIGVAVGLAGALPLTRLIRSLLFGIGSADPLTYFGVAAILGAVALAACYIPARRATRVDPMIALRYE